MGYLVKWRTKTLEGQTYVPTIGKVKSRKTAIAWFRATKGKRSLNLAPKSARIMSLKKGYGEDYKHKRGKKK